MAVTLTNIHLLHGGRSLLEDISIHINEGEHWAFVDEDDTGGSILIDLLAGRYRVFEGGIHWDTTGEIPRIGHLAAHYHFRSLSNTASFYYQQRFNMSDDEAAVTVGEFLFDVSAQVSTNGHWNFDKVITRLALGSLLEKQLIMLSNGETRRTMIAATLLKNPEVLLLDHPLAGLDVATRSDFDLLLTSIAESGIQVLLATIPEEVPAAITHVGTLSNGRLISSCRREEYRPSRKSHQNGVDQTILNRLVPTELGSFDVVVQMKNVRVQYGDRLILDGVNWTVKQGERWALRGRNGAGKSTLLSLINGDNPQAYANDIVLFDRPRGSGESIWALRRRIGFVSPELFRYFPQGHTCLDVVESGFYDTIGLFRRNDPTKRELVSQWMRLFGIEEAIDRRFEHVGFRTQRLCLLARALVKGPSLLILDEPCEGLTPQQQNVFVAAVDQICRHSMMTLIYVSHYDHQIPSCVNQSLELPPQPK